LGIIILRFITAHTNLEYRKSRSLNSERLFLNWILIFKESSRERPLCRFKNFMELHRGVVSYMAYANYKISKTYTKLLSDVDCSIQLISVISDFGKSANPFAIMRTIGLISFVETAAISFTCEENAGISTE